MSGIEVIFVVKPLLSTNQNDCECLVKHCLKLYCYYYHSSLIHKFCSGYKYRVYHKHGYILSFCEDFKGQMEALESI